LHHLAVRTCVSTGNSACDQRDAHKARGERAPAREAHDLATYLCQLGHQALVGAPAEAGLTPYSTGLLALGQRVDEGA
jgi:hypothetical protein